MAIAPQIIDQLKPSGGTDTYTVGAGERVTISSIIMHNTSTTTEDNVSLDIVKGGAVPTAVSKAWNVNVPAEGTIIVTAGITLSATDSIVADCTNDTCNIHIFGIVES